MRGQPPRWRDDRNPSLITLMDMFTEPIPDLPGRAARADGTCCALGMANDPAARPSAARLHELLLALPIGRPGSTPPGSDPGSSGEPPRPGVYRGSVPPDNSPTVQTRRKRWPPGWLRG